MQSLLRELYEPFPFYHGHAIRVFGILSYALLKGEHIEGCIIKEQLHFLLQQAGQVQLFNSTIFVDKQIGCCYAGEVKDAFSMLTDFGRFLRKLRIDRGELIKDMAAKLDVTASYLSAVETGKRNIPGTWAHEITKTVWFGSGFQGSAI